MVKYQKNCDTYELDSSSSLYNMDQTGFLIKPLKIHFLFSGHTDYRRLILRKNAASIKCRNTCGLTLEITKFRVTGCLESHVHPITAADIVSVTGSIVELS